MSAVSILGLALLTRLAGGIPFWLAAIIVLGGIVIRSRGLPRRTPPPDGRRRQRA